MRRTAWARDEGENPATENEKRQPKAASCLLHLKDLDGLAKFSVKNEKGAFAPFS